MSSDIYHLCLSTLLTQVGPAEAASAGIFGTYLLPIFIIIILILLNGLFVAAEFAIIGVRPTRVEQLAEEGDRVAIAVKAVLDDPVQQDRWIATAQLGITLASLGLGMYGEHAIAGWIDGPLESLFGFNETAAHSISIVLALMLMTFAHVVVGEMVPKSLALQFAEHTALRIAGIMALMKRLLYPAVWLLNSIGNGLLWLIGIPATDTHTRIYSPEELELLVTESHKSGLITDNEEQLIHNIFEFSERRVGQVMTPRPRIQAIPTTITEHELREIFVASPHSRFPVYEQDIDHVIGLVLVKDFVRQQVQAPGQFNLRELMRHIPIVPESMLVERLLTAFKRSHVHLALVVDEYGGTAGIVTLEDLMEEVVGEVHDEFDQAEPTPVEEIEPGVLLVRGDVLLDDLEETADVELPDEEELPDVETVGGLVVALLGRPPQPGDGAELNGINFTVDQVNGLAIETVRMEIPPSNVEADEHEPARSEV